MKKFLNCDYASLPSNPYLLDAFWALAEEENQNVLRKNYVYNDKIDH